MACAESIDQLPPLGSAAAVVAAVVTGFAVFTADTPILCRVSLDPPAKADSFARNACENDPVTAAVVKCIRLTVAGPLVFSILGIEFNVDPFR